MKKYVALLLFLVAPIVLAEDLHIALEKVSVNIHDKESIIRGGKLFANVCIACHTLIYLRYDKLAQQAGVTYAKMPTKITTWPYGIKPPDLSLEVSRRGVDWVYTYLHSFYSDSARPTHYNNLLFPNTVMPNMLEVFQGQQILLAKTQIAEYVYLDRFQWYDLLQLQKQGTMSPAQFDALVMDVVNFLAYASEPYKVEQERIGCWVLGYLFVLFVLTWLLKRAYWRGLKRVKR